MSTKDETNGTSGYGEADLPLEDLTCPVTRTIEVDAAISSLDKVQAFIEQLVESFGCSLRAQRQIALAVEEVFVNIASYAYRRRKGKAVVRVEVVEDPLTATITFEDRGVPYDPLAREDPDITLAAEDRPIGGLGVFITKNIVDGISYRHQDGKNILTLRKVLLVDPARSKKRES